MMKKNIPYFITILTLFSCSTNFSDKIYGDWRAVHIFYKGNEILYNDFNKNEWSVQLYRTKIFYIDKSSNQWVLYLKGDDEEPIRGNFRLLEANKDSDFEIYNASDKRFNGIYNRHIEIDTVEQAFKNIVYYMTLESEEIKIMAVKAERLSPKSKT